MELISIIKDIVENNSGGIKFTELISILSSDYRELLSDEVLSNIAENVEKAIRSDDHLKILDYTWGSYNRAKMFVYTP